MVQFSAAVGDDLRPSAGLDSGSGRITTGAGERVRDTVLFCNSLPLWRQSGKFLEFNRLQLLCQVLPENPVTGSGLAVQRPAGR